MKYVQNLYAENYKTLKGTKINLNKLRLKKIEMYYVHRLKVSVLLRCKFPPY